MSTFFGFASALVWVLVVVPLIWHFLFPEALAIGGWDWKRTLVAALGAPFLYGFGKSIGEIMTKQKQNAENTSPADDEMLPPNNDSTLGEPKEPAP